MSRVRIIGLGSPQGDDQFGWKVIELLQQQPLPDFIELVVLDRPGVALLPFLQNADRILLIDAADMGGRAGQLIERDSARLSQEPQWAEVTSHGIGLIDTVQLAGACQISLPPIHLYLVQIGHLSPFEPLSEPVQVTAQALVSRIRLLFTQG